MEKYSREPNDVEVVRSKQRSCDSLAETGSKSSSLNSKLGNESLESQSIHSKSSHSPSKSICSSSSTSTENLPLHEIKVSIEIRESVRLHC